MKLGEVARTIGFWSPMIIVVVVGTWGNYVITQQGKQIDGMSALIEDHEEGARNREMRIKRLERWVELHADKK